MLWPILLFLSSCSLFGNDVSQEEIFAYVEENCKALNSAITAQMTAEELRNTLGGNSIVERITFDAYEGNIVNFSCGGKGNATNAIYIGFYYSPNDVPSVMEFFDIELQEIEPGVFEWKNKDGSHQLRTIRILPNWFYYYKKMY